MIQLLQNNNLETANQILSVFQKSYAVEAALLEATDFPPLKRPIESYLKSENEFFGYFENDDLAGVVEVKHLGKNTSISSLVVLPLFFRRGIARKLVEFIFNKFNSDLFTVETGVNNKPATELYRKLGFVEIKQWNTDFGIRKVLFEKRGKN